MQWSVILLFLGILNLIIFVHELGHLLAARWIGVKVYEFSLGFGPLLFKWRIKGMRFSLRLIPLGGFVDIESEEREGSLLYEPLIKQYLVILAGIIGNIVLSLILFGIYFVYNGYYIETFLDEKPLFASVREVSYGPLIAALAEDSGLAEKLEDGQYVIVGINGYTVRYAEDVPQILEQLRNQGIYDVSVALRNISTGEVIREVVTLTSEGKLGVYLIDTKASYWDYGDSFVKKVMSPFLYGIDTVYVGGKILGQIIKDAVTGVDTESIKYAVGSPLSLYPVIELALDQPQAWLVLIHLVGVISLNLALINLLPIPPLDGWQLIRATIISKTKNRYVLSFVKFLTAAGFLLIVAVSGILIFKDITLLRAL